MVTTPLAARLGIPSLITVPALELQRWEPFPRRGWVVGADARRRRQSEHKRQCV